MNLATIRITDLTIPALIGTNDWEQKEKQNVVINVILEYDSSAAVTSDNLSDAVDYKALKSKIIHWVDNSHVQLLEKLAAQVLDIVMAEPKILMAGVRIDKPQALRFAKSVSVEMRRERSGKG